MVPSKAIPFFYCRMCFLILGLELGGPVPRHNTVEPENNKVWLQSQHGGNGGRKN